MKTNPYIEYAYPVEGYTLDRSVQDAITKRARQRDKISTYVFGGYGIAFAFALIVGFSGYPQFSIIIIPLSILPLAAFLPSLFIDVS